VPGSRCCTQAHKPARLGLDVRDGEVDVDAGRCVDDLDVHESLACRRFQAGELRMVRPRLTDPAAEYARPERSGDLRQVGRHIDDAVDPVHRPDPIHPETDGHL
jgi:hypothetical protein